MKVEVAILGSPSLVVPMAFVDVKQPVQDGIYALGKGYMRSIRLRSFHNVAFETVPMFV